MNVVLVVFDSLRKDSIGCYGSPPWGPVKTPHLDRLAEESLMMTRAYPESLPTLPTRRALYTGRRVYPFRNADFRLKGDFVGAPGWGPIPEDQPTLAEMLHGLGGYRTGLIADVYHMFKPSKNFARGFDQWMFLRGQEVDTGRSGPVPTQEEIDYWLPKEMQDEHRIRFITKCLLNMRDRVREEDYFNARVMIESARWLEQNRDAEKFFLVVESFDPHEPWFVPEYYRRMYDDSDGREQVISGYADTSKLPSDLLKRTKANYSGLVTMCDKWFCHLYETMRVQGLLENTLLIVTTDHGHSIGDGNYMGKQGYPSSPEVYDVPVLIRHPEGVGAGKKSDLFVNHTDIAATILEAAGVEPPEPIDGRPFWQAAVEDGEAIRDHVTVAWGSAVTVIDDRWWLNCKVDGRGAFLHDLNADAPFEKNVADENADVVGELFAKAVADADGGFPDFIMDLAKGQADAPGCSALAARA
jgi:arylsulfatase A-like enzyme